MKVAVSFLSSDYGFTETINKINDSSAKLIHTDIMDGKYVKNKTFDKRKIRFLSKNKTLADVHLMVENPLKYLKYFKSDVFTIIYFHPFTVKNAPIFLDKLKSMNKKIGIVINPSEDTELFDNYFDICDYVLVMGVTPGEGGRKFIPATVDKIKDLEALKNKKNYSFKIAVDGGINDETIHLLKGLDIDYVVSGSFICKSNDFNKKLSLLD